MFNTKTMLDNGKILIALCGKKQTGKSTSYKFISEILKGKKVQKFSFASKLKDIVADLFGVDYACLDGSDGQKDSSTYLLWDDVSAHIRRDFFGTRDNGNEFITHRELLQLIGTNLFRAVMPDIWVDYLKRTLLSSDADVLVVDDVRFHNEVKMLRNLGGVLVRIYRHVNSPNSTCHPSETALDNLNDSFFNFVITDNGNRTMDDLRASWVKIIETLLEINDVA